MKNITPVTIGKLIEAHYDRDEMKFKVYANFIADAYEEQGNDNGASIIRKRIDGSCKTESKVTLDDDKP